MRRLTVVLFLTIAFGVMSHVLVHTNSAGAILPQLSPSPTLVASTVPPNGDLNPYGVAFVPNGFPSGGPLNTGDVLVSNFNASSNVQGTGTTIVRIDPSGNQSLFFQGRSKLGLTTALGVLQAGFVIVGSVPTNTPSGRCTQEPSGQETGVGEGVLLVLDRQAHIVATLRDHHLLNGPWDLTVVDQGATAQVFVANVREGTVTRLDVSVDPTKSRVSVTSARQIASGYLHRCDPAALVVGPTGLVVDAAQDVLYVASTGDNAIYAVPHASSTLSDAGTGTVFIQDPIHLHGPLGLVRAPNGDLITSQGDAVNPSAAHPSELVEYQLNGQFVKQIPVDSAAGSAFGLALEATGNTLRFAAVDDATNVLDIWVLQP